LLLHELGHALVAQRSGIPVRGITLFLFGGVAEIEGEMPSAGKEFWMAIAGPLVSLVLAGLCAALWLLGEAADWRRELVLLLFVLAWINFVVLVFNMVPAFPLDGGRVLRSILWAATGNLRKATLWASLCGQAFSWLLIAWAVFSFFDGDWRTGLWTGLIGLFLNNAARSGYQMVLIKQALQGEPVSRFMNREPITVPSDLDLARWVEDYVYRYHRKTFPVAVGDQLLGVIHTRELQDLPREDWGKHTVGEVMDQDLASWSISPQTDAMEALARMQRSGYSRLLVTEGGRLVGIVSLKDLLRFLQLKMELEPTADR
jgi:Zn-dependent protease/CBS domain-containing protein